MLCFYLLKHQYYCTRIYFILKQHLFFIKTDIYNLFKTNIPQVSQYFTHRHTKQAVLNVEQNFFTILYYYETV